MLKSLSKKQESFIAAAFLATIGALIYAKSFLIGFQFDDIPVIVKNSYIRDLARFGDLFWYDPTRFLTHLSFALNCHFTGFKVFYFHLVNLALHACASFLVYDLVKVTRELSGEKKDSKSFVISLFCALVFLAHPLQTQAVSYIVQRSTILATIFYLLSIRLYIVSRLHFNWFCYLLSWLLVVAGSMTKPIFATLPIMIFSYEYFFFGFSWKKLREDFLLFLPYLMPLVMIPAFLIMFSLRYLSQDFDMTKIIYATRLSPQISRLEYLLTQFRVVAEYLRLLFVPVNQNLDYDYKLSHSFLEPAVFSSFALLLAVVALGISLFKKNKMASFGIVWFFVTLLPESSIFPIPDLIFEHRVYLPMVGFAISINFLLQEGLSYKLYILCCCLWIFSLGILTHARNIIWSDPLVFLTDVVKKSPGSARAHNNLGAFYKGRGWLGLAFQEYQKALELDPSYTPAQVNQGRFYIDQKNYALAAKIYLNVLSLDPEHFEANLNLGNIYYEQRKYDLAVAQYKKALSIDLRSEKPYLNLGRVYSVLKMYQDAEDCYRLAIEKNPYIVQVYSSLAEFYFSQEVYEKALEPLQKALKIDSSSEEIYNMLGIAYDGANRFKEAEDAFKQALQLKPDFKIAYFNLAHFYRKIGEEEKSRIFSKMAETIPGPGR